MTGLHLTHTRHVGRRDCRLTLMPCVRPSALASDTRPTYPSNLPEETHDGGDHSMKAIVVTYGATGTAGMTLAERPEPRAAIDDVVIQVHASGLDSTEPRRGGARLSDGACSRDFWTRVSARRPASTLGGSVQPAALGAPTSGMVGGWRLCRPLRPAAGARQPLRCRLAVRGLLPRGLAPAGPAVSESRGQASGWLPAGTHRTDPDAWVVRRGYSSSLPDARWCVTSWACAGRPDDPRVPSANRWKRTLDGGSSPGSSTCRSRLGRPWASRRFSGCHAARTSDAPLGYSPGLFDPDGLHVSR